MQRPIWVWVILFGYIAYGAIALGLMGYALTQVDTLSPRSQEQFDGLELDDLLWMAGFQLLPIIGGIALVMLMRAACYIFTLNLVLLVAMAVLAVGTEIATNTFTGTGYAGTLIAIGLSHWVHTYAWKLAKEGTLS